jgi:hypothetical protein
VFAFGLVVAAEGKDNPKLERSTVIVFDRAKGRTPSVVGCLALGVVGTDIASAEYRGVALPDCKDDDSCPLELAPLL